MAKVLVVDDDPRIREVLHHLLSRAGHEVIEAEDGQVGIKTAQAECPDAILLDLVMPNMGGLAVLDQLKKHSQTANIPVIMLTAHDNSQVRERSMSKGAALFLGKPWKPGELELALQQVVKNEPPPPEVPPVDKKPGEMAEIAPQEAGTVESQTHDLEGVVREFIGVYFGFTRKEEYERISHMELDVARTNHNNLREEYQLEGTASVSVREAVKPVTMWFDLKVAMNQEGVVIERHGELLKYV